MQQLPQGAVVLPGLDTDLDEARGKASAASETTKVVSPNIPRRAIRNIAMHALLERFGIGRGDVDILKTAGARRARGAAVGGDASVQCDGAVA